MEKTTKVIVSADTSKFERGMRQVKLSNAKTTKAMKSAWGGVKTALAGVAGIAGMGLVIKKSLEVADAIGKTADKLGISTDALQEYRYAAKLAGVEETALDMGLQRFIRRTAEAVQGKGELKGVLEQYNIAVKDATGKTRNQEEVLNDLADVIARTESESEQLRIAFKAFDSEGAALVNMLKDGASGLDQMRQDARDLGIVMDEKLIRQSEQATDEIEKLTRVLKVQFMSAVVGLAPEIAKIAHHMTDWWKANKKLVLENVAGYAHKIKDVILELKAVYDSLPEGVVGAAGLGLIGAILFGPQAGAVIALIALTSTKINQFKKDHPEIFDPNYEGLEGGLFRGAGVAGDWGAPESPQTTQETPTPENTQQLQEQLELEKELREMYASDALEKANEYDQSMIDAHQAMRDYENELIMEDYEMKKEMDEEFRQWEIEKAMEYDEALIEGELATNEQRKAIHADLHAKMAAVEQAYANAKLALFGAAGNAMLSIMVKDGKKLFIAQKALQVGMAVMSAFLASNLALATFPGPPYTIPLAAAVLKLGLMQAAAVAAVSIGQIATGASGSPGDASYLPPSDANDPSIYDTDDEKRGSLTINIEGDMIGDEAYLEMLAEKISEAVEDRDIRLISSRAKYADALT